MFRYRDMARAPVRKPIIWAFSLSRLDRLLENVVPEYASSAEIRVFHLGFDAALDAARERLRAGEEVDVIVSAGANGAYLRARAPVPVVVIGPTGFDLLSALSRARRLSGRVAISSPTAPSRPSSRSSRTSTASRSSSGPTWTSRTSAP